MDPVDEVNQAKGRGGTVGSNVGLATMGCIGVQRVG